METLTTETALTDEALSDLWGDAMAAASPFANPATLRDARELSHLATDDWLTRVIRRPVKTHQWPHLTNVEMDVMVRAIQADLVHLRALRDERAAEHRRADQERAEAARLARQAKRDEWAALAASLPVRVEVWHNWTARHLDGYEQGADHIVVRADLAAGRFRRPANHPLCWTPSRAHPLRYVEPNIGDERRLPDCKACIRHAERLAAR